MEKKHICIVGGGVIGIACAYYLLPYGYQITLIDQKTLGNETSHGNCGFIHHRSHLLPLAQSGAINSTLRMILTKGWNSPVYVKPRLSLALWKWFWQFYQNCQNEPLEHNILARMALSNSSFDLYRQLFHSKKIPYQWHEHGSLKVFRDPMQMQYSKTKHEFLQDKFGLKCEWLNGSELAEHEPTLKSDLAGGCFYPSDAHLQPNLLMKAWADHIKQQGVKVHEYCIAQDLIRENGKARAIKIENGTISADYFIYATGAFTPLLKNQLHSVLPIQPGKGYTLSLAYSTIKPIIPIILPEKNVAITPMDEFYRLGSIMEFVGYNKKLPDRRFNLLKQSAALYLKNFHQDTVVEKWCGLRSMTPDGVPYIGLCPEFNNVYVAAGHNMEGITMAPATGKLIAELIAGEKPHIDPDFYRLNRGVYHAPI